MYFLKKFCNLNDICLTPPTLIYLLTSLLHYYKQCSKIYTNGFNTLQVESADQNANLNMWQGFFLLIFAEKIPSRPLRNVHSLEQTHLCQLSKIWSLD